MKKLFLIPALIGICAFADEFQLRTKTVEISPPEGAIILEKKEIENRFTKGNPPNIVFEIKGSGSTITIKESITLKRDARPSEFSDVMIDAVRNSTNNFNLIEGKNRTEGNIEFFEFSYTDTSDNDLKMIARTRLFVNERTLIIVGYRMPINLREIYEDRLLSAIQTFTFTE